MRKHKVQTVFILIPQLENIIFVLVLNPIILKVHCNTVLHTESRKKRDGESFQATLYLRGSFAEKAMAHFSDPL